MLFKITQYTRLHAVISLLFVSLGILVCLTKDVLTKKLLTLVTNDN